jgi:hypothetical protein
VPPYARTSLDPRPAWVVLSVCAREGPDLLEHGEYRLRRRLGARAFATGALHTQSGRVPRASCFLGRFALV